MRPFAYACATFVVASAPIWHTPVVAQDWLRQAIAPEARAHDFGTVARAAKTEHRFLIKNTSNQDLHLRSVRASCGCTTPIIETEWIRPGETGSILARFNTGTFSGSKSATLTVSIDKPGYTELQLNVKGYIRRDVVLNPGELSFGEIPVGEAQTLTVSLDYAGRPDWQIVGVESPLPFVQIQAEETSRGGGRVAYNIHATLSADAPIGTLQNQVLLKTNDRNLTTVPIRLLANVQPAVQFSPQEIALGTVEPERAIAQRLIVKAREEFRVVQITSEHATVEFAANETVKQAHVLNVQILPKRQPTDGAVRSELLVKIDALADPLRIPLTFSQLTPDADSSVVQVD